MGTVSADVGCRTRPGRRTQRIVNDMSVDIDIKACTILERFGAELLDAQVDYCCTMDLHEFSITRGGLTHEVGFTERVLQLKDIPDIEEVVAKLAEEIKASTQPRKVRVGSHVSDKTSKRARTAHS